MFKKSWYVEELKVVQQEVKEWPKWKLGQPEQEGAEQTQADKVRGSSLPTKKASPR
jgi:hypothetical protein